MKGVGLFLCVAVVSVAAQSFLRPDFNQAPVLELSNNPLDAAVGDLNNDGHLDLVLATDSNNALVLLNRRDGTFDSPQSFPTGGTTHRLAVADLNGDGDLDVAALRDSTIAILLGNGKGGFDPPVNYPADNNPRRLAVGDFNGDGAPDIVSGSFGANRAVVLFNDGSGRFNRRLDVGLGDLFSSVTVADVNADGNADMLIALYYANSVAIILGNGDGTFRAPLKLSVGPSPSLVAVADFNEDGRLDLAVFQSQSVSVWAGNGNGGFASAGEVPMVYSGGHLEVEVSDLNADGHADLVWAAGDSNTINILLGNGQGRFSTNDYIAGISISGVAVGDLNGDGRPDIAAPSFIGSTLSLLFNKGDSTFAAPRVYQWAWTPVDLNGDQKLDAVTVTRNKMYVTLGNGDGTFGDVKTNDVPGGWDAFAVGDVNRDGRVDIVLPVLDKRLGLLLGVGDGTFINGPNRSLSVYPFVSTVGLADLNNDGKLDVILSAVSNAIVLVGNGDGTFQAELPIENSGQPPSMNPSLAPINVGDFNNDGTVDLVLGLDIFLGHGDGTFSLLHTQDLDFLVYVTVADLDADGNLDLVAVSSRGQIVIYGGDGQGGFSELSRLQPSWAAANAEVADFNLDGKLDLAVSLAYNGRVFLGNGDGTFVPGGDFLFRNFRVGDVNGDGQPDIVSGNVFLNQTFTKLAITRTPSGMELGWPGYTAGMMLESTENLLAPNWQGVRSPVSIVGDRYVVTDTNAVGNRFYRLRRQ